jgi:AAA domain
MGEEKTGIVLPTAPSEIEKVNPSTLILFGLQKCGKTTEIAKLPNLLEIDTEEGTGFVKVMKISPPKEYGPVSKMNWLKDAAKKIIEAGRPYDYVAIDTFTQVDEWAEWSATKKYMDSITGQKFNRDKNGQQMRPTDPDYDSVHNLPNGFGYRFSRQEMIDIYELTKDLGRICTIYVCHVADKSVVSKISNQEIVTRDISLTGKVKDIIGRRVDAIGYIWNEDGQAMISFKGNEEKIGGIRSPHIRGYSGPLLWEKIFISEKLESK